MRNTERTTEGVQKTNHIIFCSLSLVIWINPIYLLGSFPSGKSGGVIFYIPLCYIIYIHVYTSFYKEHVNSIQVFAMLLISLWKEKMLFSIKCLLVFDILSGIVLLPEWRLGGILIDYSVCLFRLFF